MKFRFFKRAKGGRIPATRRPASDFIALSPGGVLCEEKDCDWAYSSWSVKEQLSALEEHKKSDHRT